jgi:hypothetical protein
MTYVLTGKTVNELKADIEAKTITCADALTLVEAKIAGKMRQGALKRWTRVRDMLAKGSLDTTLAYRGEQADKPKASTPKAKAPTKSKAKAKVADAPVKLDNDAMAAFMIEQTGDRAGAMAFLTAFTKAIGPAK